MWNASVYFEAATFLDTFFRPFFPFSEIGSAWLLISEHPRAMSTTPDHHSATLPNKRSRHESSDTELQFHDGIEDGAGIGIQVRPRHRRKKDERSLSSSDGALYSQH